MSKPIPWWLPQMTGRESQIIQEVLESNFLNDGDFTARFEAELAARLGCKYVVAVTSGTTALFAALAALGIGLGHEVIVPDVTFIATANAVTWTGAQPVLVDVDPHTLTIAPDAVLRAINPRTRAIIPVHVSGRPADMKNLLPIAADHKLSIVEDAAEALLSRYHDQYLGTLGHAGCFSFSPNKTITTGQGGGVATNDEQLYRRLHEIKDQGRPVRGTGGNDLHPALGYNLKFTNLQAAVGLAQLCQLDHRTEKLRRIYALYAQHLSGCPDIELPGFDIAAGVVPQWVDAFTDRRDELDTYLRQRNIHCRPFWYPLHTQKPYHRPDDQFPHSSRQTRRALWLPSAFTLTEEDIETACRHIRCCLETSAVMV